ncbi:unnamed protein product [Microthlaspi erraticum]|uniref:Uncharacterized protein n=1 Tax=Microthlaspi erraticum TaxID=1685480 RepID=A0A6D2HPL7_9BRAS|nr:unnamed protein product [Microthlaspi erraticum]
MFHARPNHIRPSEVSAKVQNRRPITHHDPGNMSRGRPRHNRSRQPRTTAARAGKQASRPRNLLAYHGRCVRAGNYVPRPAENSSAKSSSVRPHGRPRIRPATTVPIVRPMTRSSGRSSRPTVPTPRSTRSPFPTYFQARLNPKPPLKT